MARLAGKVALVVGCASGIGAATAAAMAREGARVVLADLDLAGAQVQAERIAASGGDAVAVRADLADEVSLSALIGFVEERFRRLDVLHNNAAATTLAATRDGPVATLDPEVWDLTMRVNLRGPMLTIKHALPLLLQSRGSIINTASNAGLSGDLGHTAYAVSKGGLMTLTLYVAAQHGADGVRCNAISPGLIVTDMMRAAWPVEAIAELHAHELAPRNGSPEDIAQAAVFLASDESAFINGQVLRVDGGALSHQPYYAAFRAARAHAPRMA